jgi:hypothetical protein
MRKEADPMDSIKTSFHYLYPKFYVIYYFKRIIFYDKLLNPTMTNHFFFSFFFFFFFTALFKLYCIIVIRISIIKKYRIICILTKKNHTLIELLFHSVILINFPSLIFKNNHMSKLYDLENKISILLYFIKY